MSRTETEAPKIFSAAYYERLRQVEERHWWACGMRHVAAALLAPALLGQDGGRALLDAGCGTGVTLPWAAALLDADRSVGVDLSPHALAHCRNRGQRDLVHASVLALPFRDQCFDLVTSVDVLQHLPLPDGDARALTDAYRVLRPGGVLFIRTNARRPGDDGTPGAHDYQRYTTELLAERVRAAGFEVVRLTYANGLSVWLDRVRPSRSAAGPGAHAASAAHAAPDAQDQGLRIRCLPPALSWANRLLLWLLRAEAAWLKTPGRSLRRGHSTMCVARRSTVR